MQFNCHKNLLQKAIQLTEKGTSTKSTLPILSNLLFDLKDNKLTISSTNMEISIEKEILVNGIEDGSVLIHAKTISNIINKLPAAEVSIKVLENGTIEIKSKDINFNIHGLPPEEFPSIQKIQEGEPIVISKDKIKELIKQTIISVSIDESKNVLNGVLLEISDNFIKGVSTDGFRLSFKEYEFNNQNNSNIKIIIPTKALLELQGILSDIDSKDINLFYTSENISFVCEDFYLSTRIIKGQYPEYNQVIPNESKIKLTINKKDFTFAMERCAIIASMANTSTNIIKIELVDNKLLIKASTADVGNASEIVTVDDNINNEKVEISLNVRLIIEALKTIESEKISFMLIDSLKPVIISPIDNTTTSKFLYVIMPIRTGKKA